MMDSRGDPCTQGPQTPGDHTVKVQLPPAISSMKESPQVKCLVNARGGYSQEVTLTGSWKKLTRPGRERTEEVRSEEGVLCI